MPSQIVMAFAFNTGSNIKGYINITICESGYIF